MASEWIKICLPLQVRSSGLYLPGVVTPDILTALKIPDEVIKLTEEQIQDLESIFVKEPSLKKHFRKHNTELPWL